MTKDEFVEILKNDGIETPGQLAEKVLKEVEEKKLDIWKVKMGIDAKGIKIIDI